MQSQAKNEEAQLQAQRVDLETLAQNMADKTKFYNRMVKTIKIDVKVRHCNLISPISPCIISYAH